MPDSARQRVLTLLLVDDHAVVRSGLANMLSAQRGLKVIGEVGEGAMAVEVARRSSPDVVLLDVVMPGMGGLECLRQLKRQHPLVRVLMLTSSENPRDADEALKAGADGYVTKTASSAELIRAISVVAKGERFVSEEVQRLLADYSSSSALLTPREIEVLQLLRKGMSNPDIGYLLGITPRTAKAHVSALLVKLGAQDRAEAVARGFEKGLLRP